MYKNRQLLPAVLLLLVTSVTALPADAEIRGITVAVHESMSGSFLVYRIKKSLERVPGVHSVTVDFKKREANLTVAPGESIDVDQIPRALRRAGFTARLITADIVGWVEEDQQQSRVLKVSGTDQSVLFTVSGPKLEQELSSLAARVALVQVEGQLRRDPENGLIISPQLIWEMPQAIWEMRPTPGLSRWTHRADSVARVSCGPDWTVGDSCSPSDDLCPANVLPCHGPNPDDASPAVADRKPLRADDGRRGCPWMS